MQIHGCWKHFGEGKTQKPREPKAIIREFYVPLIKLTKEEKNFWLREKPRKRQKMYASFEARAMLRRWEK